MVELVSPGISETDVVSSIRADANPQLTGDVILASGTNITLNQVGQTITINESGGGSPGGNQYNIQSNNGDGTFYADDNFEYFPIPLTVSAPTVVPTGTGSSDWRYAVVGYGHAGHCFSATTTVQNADTLDGTNFNTITLPTDPNITSYDVYLLGVGSGGATGLIGSGFSPGDSFDDQSGVGDGTNPNPENTTAGVYVSQNLTVANANLLVTAGTNGAGMEVIPGWNNGFGTWINLDTTGASGLGSGGPGNDAWLAYASTNGEWFNNALVGDITYRNLHGRLLFGTSGVFPTIMIDDSQKFNLVDQDTGLTTTFDLSALTDNRIVNLPDQSGTIALETGASGSFTTVDLKTVTVVNGIITSIT